MRSLKEVNLVSCLKLVWRILSSHSLWVSLIKKVSYQKDIFLDCKKEHIEWVLDV